MKRPQWRCQFGIINRSNSYWRQWRCSPCRLQFAFNLNINDEDDIELSSFSSCSIGDETITYLKIPDNPSECSTEVGEGRATDPGF